MRDASKEAAIAPSSSERYFLPISIVAFSVALGVGFITIPLSALASGHDPATVGYLTAVSAIAQLISRSSATWFLARISDRWLITGAATLLAATYALMIASTTLLVFFGAMVTLGMARALFWTGSQTHAVRGGDNTVRALAIMNTLSGVGTVVGPILGGVLIESSVAAALGAAVLAAAVASFASIGLTPFPTYDRSRPLGEPHVWRQPGVTAACWASFAGGGWRGLMNSYVPAVFVAAGQTSTTIGFLLSLAEGVSIMSHASLTRLAPRHVRGGLLIGVVTVGACLAVLPFFAWHAAAAALILAVSGAGGGVVTTLGPAAAANSVPPGQLGAAISVTGTFRALGLLALPFGVATALAAVPMTVAMVVAGVAIGTPTLLVHALNRSGGRWPQRLS